MPLAHMDGADILVEAQYVPAGHGVGDFKPSALQCAPAGQATQLLLLTTPLVGRNVPAEHSVGAVVAGLGQYAPAVQFRHSSMDRAPVAGMNVPAAHACGVADADGQ